MKGFEDQLKICQAAGISVLAEGVHGIGKSERVEAYARDRGYHCEVLFLSHQETGDLIGIPYLDGKNTDWSTPVWLQRMYDAEKKGKKCVLFLDELNRARLDVRQSALQLVLCKQIHQHHLPKDTLVVAAVNPDDEYQVQELDPALNDRFVIFTLRPDAAEWINWARKNEVAESVISFIAENEDKLWWKSNKENEKNHPTPRSWKKVSDFLKILSQDGEYDQKTKESIVLNFLRGKIGVSVGNAFFHFWTNRSDFSAKKVEDLVKDVKDKSKKNVDEGIEILKPHVDKVELIKLGMIVEDLAKKYTPKKGEKPEDFFKRAYPLSALLYTLPLEVLHSQFKSIKGRDGSAKDKSQYETLIFLDSFADGKYKTKYLFSKIIEKMV